MDQDLLPPLLVFVQLSGTRSTSPRVFVSFSRLGIYGSSVGCFPSLHGMVQEPLVFDTHEAKLAMVMATAVMVMVATV